MEPHRPPSSYINHSQQPSDGSTPPGRKRVGFTQSTSQVDGATASSSRSPEIVLTSAPDSTESTGHNTPVALRSDVSHEELSEEIHKAFGQLYVPKPRPAMRRAPRTPPRFHLGVDGVDEAEENEYTRRSGLQAQQRAAKLSKSVGTYSASAPGSRRNSKDMLTGPGRIEMPRKAHTDFHGETTDDDTDGEGPAPRTHSKKEAERIVYNYDGSRDAVDDFFHIAATPLASGQATPINESDIEAGHGQKHSKYKNGVLALLLKSSSHSSNPVRNTKITGHGNNPSVGSLTLSAESTAANSPMVSPPLPGAVTPNRRRVESQHWYNRSANASSNSISMLVGSSFVLARTGQRELGDEIEQACRQTRSGMGKRSKSKDSIMSSITRIKKLGRKKQSETTAKIADTLMCQRYLRILCESFMAYGAPSHRIEEIMLSSGVAADEPKTCGDKVLIPGTRHVE